MLLTRIPGSCRAGRGIGVATNNVAECGGLRAGLKAAVQLDADGVEIRMDSKLVVEQICGGRSSTPPRGRSRPRRRSLAARSTGSASR